MNAMISGYTENGVNPAQAYHDNRFTGMENTAATFAQTMQRRGAEGTAVQGMRSPQEMTMGEYKQYIAQKIRQIPVHPSRRSEYVSVTISEEGYMAM